MSKDGLKRKLVAILSADVEGYSRLMSKDEASTIRTLTAYKEMMTHKIERNRGRVVDAPGDNLLADFPSVVDAVQCAVEIQRDLAERNQTLPQERRMVFRIGVNLGDIVEEEDRIYGDGVNIAARIESLCKGGGVCISGTAFEHVENKLDLAYENLGDYEVKNIAKPVRVYRVLSDSDTVAQIVIRSKQTGVKKWRKMLVAAAAVLVAVVATVAVWNFYARSPAKYVSPNVSDLTVPNKPSIAVLPFENMSGEADQEYFADGMTDELITDLSKISGLLVISRNSSFTYKGKKVNVRQVAEELNVKYVLEGSIQRAGDRVRIRAQLIDGVTDHHVWAESYDAIMENIFDLQDEITKKIAAILAVKLTVKEQNNLITKETTDIEAYDAFVKGWEHLHRETPNDLVQAIFFFKKAIELDPMYSRAHAALAWTYLSSSFRFRWQEFVNTHLQYSLLARKHLDLAMRNPTSTAHLVASKMAMNRRRYEESVIHAQLALSFDTNDPDANLNMARVLMATGKPEEGLDFVTKTIQLDPRNMAASLSAAGMAYFIMGDLQKALVKTERAINHNPIILDHYEMLSAIYALLERNQDAQAAFEKGLNAWTWGIFPANLTTLMSFFPVKDRNIADRYAGGLAKAGWPGQPSDYHKILEENRLTGDEIRILVSGEEITVYEFSQIFWIHHSENGRYLNISKAREGKWWIEGDMLCYRMGSGNLQDLNDCGEIYRNPDAMHGSKKQYFHVKDYIIAALSAKE